jgi:hypothetical protein
LFDAVERSTQSGFAPADWTILISESGGIEMLADCDWPLDTLQADRGAGMVYRISQQGEHVRLEGRAGQRTCLFETARPDGAARSLPANHAFDRLLRPTFLNPDLPVPVAPALLPAVEV